MENNTQAEKYLEYKGKMTNFVRNKIFDIIAIFTVLVMALLSLGALEFRDITFKNVLDILVESFPFYFAATMLSRNYYTKGAYLGKEQDCFKNAVSYYSQHVTKLDGKALSILPRFCNEYNERTLKSMQEAILHSVAITMERFHEMDESLNKPLKIATEEEVKKAYGNEVAKAVEKCKRCKVKGINPNILLSNINNPDSTNLGDNEKELANKRTVTYAIVYFISILFMSLIGIKSVIEWGWMGLFLTLFKLAFVVFAACSRYFEGYEDITINVVDHLFRKTDVLKEFEYWRSLNDPNYTVVSKSETAKE